MWLPLMLPVWRDEPFDDNDFIFEPVIEGRRMILSVERGKVRLFTRNGLDVSAQYPELHNVPIHDHADAIFDGVVSSVNPQTQSMDFESVQQRSRLRKPMSIMQARADQPVIYCVFDILSCQGEDLRSRTLMERKQILEGVLGENAHYYRVFHENGAGISLFRAVRHKFGGIIAKKKDSLYSDRRDPAWLQIIQYQYAEVEIAGYRKRTFGWLLQHQNRQIGVLEGYVPLSYQKAFNGVSRSIMTGEDNQFVYVQPSIKVRIRFRMEQRRTNGILSPEFVDFVAN